MPPSAPPPAKGPWYAEAFGRDYLERYAHRDEETAREEIPFLTRALRAKPGALILDLCCGAGRYSRPLAEAGYRVVGVDLSPDLLRRAERNAARTAHLRADMRALPLAGASVDGVVNLFTSFGYFEADEENLAALREAARVLKPGGALLLDFFNLAPTLAALAPETRRQVRGGVLIERRHYDARRRRLEKTIRLIEQPSGKVRRELVESVRAFSPAELAELFERAGLELRGRFGSLRGAPFDEKSSPRCVSVGRKRRSAGSGES